MFNVSDAMRLGESYDIKLLLSASKPLDELKEEVAGEIESAELPFRSMRVGIAFRSATIRVKKDATHSVPKP